LSVPVVKTDWRLVTLEEVALQVSRRVDNPSESGFDKFVGLEHLETGELKVRNWGSTANLISSMKIFSAGDTLFARRNAYLRRASMADFDGVCSGDAIVLREKPEKAIPGFLPLILNTDAFWDYAISNAAGSMSKRVNIKTLLKYEFLLPPLEEQRRIAEILWAADVAVEKHQKCRSDLLKLEKATLAEIMPPNVPFRELLRGSIQDFPAAKLGDVCEKITDGTHQSPPFEKAGIPFLTISNVVDGVIDWDVDRWISPDTYEMLTRTTKPEIGDVLYTVVARYGDPVLIDWEQPFSFQRHIAIIKPDRSKLSGKYLCHFLNSTLGKKQAEIYAEGLAQKTITLKSLSQFCIALPPMDVQVKICDRLDRIHEQIQNYSRMIENARHMAAHLKNTTLSG